MKKRIIGFFTIMLIIMLAGCGAKEKLEEKAGEAIAEKMIKSAGGDVDLDGDKITIKGENKEEVTFGDNEWPTSELAKSIPEFKDGTVSAVMTSPDSVIITLEPVEKEAALAYFETVKSEFPQENFEMNSTDMTSFSGKNDAGITVSLTYSVELLTITATKDAQ